MAGSAQNSPLRVALLVTLIARFTLAESPATATAPTTQAGVSIETYFSPKDKIAPIVVQLIDGAERTLDMAAFTFSHRDVAMAIIRAHERGVKIRFVMDYTQSRLVTCRAIDLIEAGIEVRTRRRRGFQHNKYLVIDQAIVLTGSFNFAPSADNLNTENVLVIRNAPEIVAAFVANHEKILADTLRKQP
jgi:phosphatidylserine/phosphatidylglycerophosphate/cardiolipin synthase-like enzyme